MTAARARIAASSPFASGGGASRPEAGGEPRQNGADRRGGESERNRHAPGDAARRHGGADSHDVALNRRAEQAFQQGERRDREDGEAERREGVADGDLAGDGAAAMAPVFVAR